MTNKPLILGVVTALAMAGGQTYAATPCPHSESVETLMMMPNFSCVDIDGDSTFSHLSFSGQGIGSALVTFGDDSVRLERGPGQPHGLPTGTMFDYQLQTVGHPTNPPVITATATVSVSGTTPNVRTRTSFNGVSFVVRNAGSGETQPGTDSVIATNSSTIAPGTLGRLNSITNDFSLIKAVPTPGPMSLSLIGLGLAGLALARRRRS